MCWFAEHGLVGRDQISRSSLSACGKHTLITLQLDCSHSRHTQAPSPIKLNLDCCERASNSSNSARMAPTAPIGPTAPIPRKRSEAASQPERRIRLFLLRIRPSCRPLCMIPVQISLAMHPHRACEVGVYLNRT